MTTTAELHITPVNPTTVLVQGSERLRQWFDDNTLDVPGAEYSRLYKQGKWDGKWHPAQWCRLVAEDTYELRTTRGILPRLLRDMGYTETALGELYGSHEAEMAQYIGGQPRWKELRDYQQEAFQSVIRSGWGRIAFATNAGKGAVIAMLADFARRNAHSVLILCDEKSVFDALEGELYEWAKIRPFPVKQGTHELPPPGITLAMVQSLTRRLKDDPDAWKPWLQMQAMLLLDEADKATADTWQALCRGAKAVRWCVGFSGTFPDDRTYDDWRLEKLMGPVLMRARNRELVDRGISAKPLIELHGFDATEGLYPLLPWDDWWAVGGPGRRLWVFAQAIVSNPARHAVVASLIRPGVPTAVVINRIDHGAILQDAIDGAVFLDGSISEHGRLTALEGFREGKFHVLIVTKILDRGTNRLGFAQDVIFASGEGSNRQTLQRMGRGLRRADGKATLRLVDIIDHVKTHEGDDRRLAKAADFLHEAGRKRVELYTAEGFDLQVTPS